MLGADLNDVRDFLRHKSMTMTLRYAHLVKARRSRTAHLLDTVYSGAKAGIGD
jgi:site-specific recombinase XerD